MATATTSASTASNVQPAVPELSQSQRLIRFLVGSVLIIVLALLVAEIDRWIGNQFKAAGVARNPLEYPLTAAVIGLIANFILRVTRLFQFIRPAIRTEFYLKVGLVLLGARVALPDVLAKGMGGLVQAVIMVCCVFFFTWWLGGRFKLPTTLRAVMATANAVCGVSAAIAAAGAVQAKKEEVSYITTLVILTALPMMIIMPPIAHALNLPDTVAGAWFGGNIDTTAAVVGAGTIFSSTAQSTAAVVKLAQNVMIGFVAFALALYFATVVNRGQGERPSASIIWQRFPKFVIGFVLVSVLVSIGAIPKELIPEIDTVSKWILTLGFISIALDFSFISIREAGWNPILVYLGATVFNTILALIVSSIIFGSLMP